MRQVFRLTHGRVLFVTIDFRGARGLTKLLDSLKLRFMRRLSSLCCAPTKTLAALTPSGRT
jgi:hypothetical protein